MTARSGYLVPATLLAAVLCGQLWGEERVTIRPPDSAGLMTMSGDIISYDDVVLRIRTRGPQPIESIPSAQVAAVEYYRIPAHQSGLQAFHSGDLPTAIAHLREAAQQESRGWVRREILALLVRSHLRLDQRGEAASRFVEIASEEPQTRHWGTAPLIWSSGAINETLRSAARRWFVQNSDAVRLIGAGLLLSSPEDAAAARTELQRLTRLPNPHISGLARAQLWRDQLTTAAPSAPELDRWRREVERMPESIQGGPWYLVAQGALARSDLESAAAALLRVFLVHHENEALAAQAGLEAARLLERLNRKAEADIIAREVVERFAGTSFAGEARGILDAATP